MGKKIDALKWAMTTKPKVRSSNKEIEIKHTIGQLFVPLRSDSMYVLGAAFSPFILLITLYVVGLNLGIFGIALWMGVFCICFRASLKLGDDWTDENLEIVIRHKTPEELKR